MRDRSQRILNSEGLKYAVSLHGFHIRKLTYSLKFICNPQISHCGAFIGVCRQAQSGKKFELLGRPMRSDKVALCLLVSAHIVNERPFCSLAGATFPETLCFLLVILLFKMAPKHCAQVLSRVPKCRRLQWALKRKHVH